MMVFFSCFPFSFCGASDAYSPLRLNSNAASAVFAAGGEVFDQSGGYGGFGSGFDLGIPGLGGPAPGPTPDSTAANNKKASKPGASSAAASSSYSASSSSSSGADGGYETFGSGDYSNTGGGSGSRNRFAFDSADTAVNMEVSDGEVNFCFKRLGSKKDAATKLRALEELRGVIARKTRDELAPCMYTFGLIYTRLAMDSEAKVPTGPRSSSSI